MKTSDKLYTRFFSLVRVFFLFIFFSFSLHADPFPPDINGSANDGMHYAPAPWPTTTGVGGWQPYTRFGNGINDPRTQDPSNGGTAPQNYVNIASSCVDTNEPSIYYYLHKGATPAEDVIMFRWRVEQIANTYATGPSAGSYSSGDVWNSALWTVFFDINGDGYRDIAAHLDGSSGSPSEPIDMIYGIYGNVPTQSIDYTEDPNIKLIGHNPTAFVDASSKKIYNYHNTNTADTNWPNGSSEIVWDYGTTRSSVNTDSPCTEYYIDYQIPIGLIDASAFGGPTLTRETPISMLFCTSNSLNNPFQKDCAINKEWIADPDKPAPFGDFVSFDKNESYTQVIVDDITGIDCNPVTLSAKVKDSIAIVDGEAVPSVASIDFYVYRDADGDGIANDGDTWTFAVAGTRVDFNTWTADWDSETLFAGQYLVGVKATDDPTKVDDGMDTNGTTNVTFSYLTQAEVDALPGKPVNETWWANPEITGVKSIGLAVNNCGIAPTLDKSVDNAEPIVGETITFTLAFSNPPLSPDVVTLFQLKDILPTGFIYNGNLGGDLAPYITVQPGVGDTGTISWEINGTDGIKLEANTTKILTFEVNASIATGLYNNVANAISTFGEARSNVLPISVGAPLLNIAIAADKTLYAEGETVFYTVKYGNDSSVNTTGTVVEVNLTGLGVSAPSNISDGGIYNASTGLVTWNVGSLLSGSTGNSFTFDVNTSDPFNAINNPIVVPTTINSNETNLQTATATVMVDVPTPNLIIQKSANVSFVTPANNDQVIYTITIANTGTGPAIDVNITDVVPVGFTFVSAPAGVHTSGTVEWTIGTLDENASTSVTLILQVDNANIDTSSTNIASVVASNVSNSKEDSVTIGIYQTPMSVGGTCYAPTGFIDTSDNVNVLAAINTNNEIRDEYLAFNNGTVFDDTLYQEYTFANTLATTGDTFSDINFTIEYLEKNLDGSKIEIWNGGTLLNTIILSGHSSSQNQEVIETIDLLANGVDTVSELNNLKIRFLAHGTGNNNSRTQATDYVQVCMKKNVVTSPNLHLQYKVDKLNATVADSLLYTVTYGNSGSADAIGTTITATVPAGLENIIPSGTGTYDSNTRIISWSGIGIVSGGTGTLTFTADIVDSFTGDSLPSTATLTHSSSSTNLSASVLTQIEGVISGGTPNIVIQKTVDKTALIPGNIVTYTLTVQNVGDGTATNLTVTDDIPDQNYLRYVNSATGGDSIFVTDGAYSVDIIDWHIASLTSGSSVTLTYQMQVSTIGVPSGLTLLDNNASSADDNGTSQSNTVTVTLNTNPNLTISKSVSNPNAVPGERVTYTMFVRNIGTGDANSATITDPIPANVSFEGGITTPVGTSGYFDGVRNEVVFTLGTLAADSNATVTFQARVASPLPQGNTLITNTAYTVASNAAIKSATASITSVADIDLTVDIYGPSSAAYPTAILDQNVTDDSTIIVDDASQFSVGQVIKVGSVYATIDAINANVLILDAVVSASKGETVTGAITYKVLYQNHGDADATDTNLTVVLPVGIVYYDAVSTPNSAPVQGTNGNVTWNLGTVESGAIGSYQIIAFPSATGSYTIDTNIVSSDTVDNLEDNNTDSITTIFGGLKVEKSTSTPTIIQPGSGFTSDANYTITIDNTLNHTVSDVNVTDSLPAGFEYNATTSVTAYDINNTPTDIFGSISIDPEPSQPVWGNISVPANGRVEINFTTHITDSVGAATYQNGVYTITSEANTSVTQYDELNSQAEDVTVLDGTDGMVEGYIFEDKNGNNIFDSGDIPYVNVEVTITDDSDPSFYYTAITDGLGYFSRVVAEGNWTIQHDTTNITLSLSSGYSNPTPVVVFAGETFTDLNPYVDFVAHPSITLIKTVDSISGTGTIGDTITYNFEVNNTGNVDLTNITLTDVNATVSGGPIDLAAGAGDNTTFTATHIIDAADIAAGQVTNQAIVTGTPPSGPDVNDTSDDNSPNEDDPTVVTATNGLAASNPSITLIKTGTFIDENNDGYADIGETISYEFNITNIGNVTLYDINITDDNAVITGGPIASLAPGESDTTTFTGLHTVTWQDIIDGKVINQAIVTGTPPSGPDVNDTSDDPQNPVDNDTNNDGEPDDETSTGLPIKPPVSTDDIYNATTGENVIIDIVNNDSGGTFAVDATTVTLTPPVSATDIITVDGDVIGFVVPGEGTWSVDETTGEVTFSPEDGYVGDPTPIEYTIEDTQGSETTSQIAINYPPVANDNNATADRDEVVTLDVLTNDQNTTAPLDPTTVRLIGPDGNETDALYVLNQGIWIVETNGSVTFEPDPNFGGDAQITYIVRETNGDISNEALITIRYPGFPIATDNLDIPITEYRPTVIDVLANGDDWGSNGAGTQIITFTQPIYGTVDINDNGTPDDPTDDVLIYTPAPDVNNVTDQFTYTITDALGFTSTATVTLNVNCATSQSSDGGDALGFVSMLLLAIMTTMTGLYFVRKEEKRGEV